MNFTGSRDFNTKDPIALRKDLQQQNYAVEDALRQLDAERAARFVPRLTSLSTMAVHDELVLCDTSSNAIRITLPPSDLDKAGRLIGVVQKSNTFDVTVLPHGRNTVHGTTSDVFTAIGFRLYIDDGQGGWWRNS